MYLLGLNLLSTDVCILPPGGIVVALVVAVVVAMVAVVVVVIGIYRRSNSKHCSGTCVIALINQEITNSCNFFLSSCYQNS